MLKRNAVAIAISSLFVASAVNAATIYKEENGDFLKLYGEVGVGGHIGANYNYGEFYTDQSFIDDSFATMGVKGKKDKIHYRLELDYERENWKYGTGDMVLAIDKVFLGYDILPNHYLEVGLADTAFDDYDKWGDFTFDTTVETGEAGDQDTTIKYEGYYFDVIKVGASYTYGGESSSGSELGDIVNGYLGYFGDSFSAVAGFEGRGGSDGLSKYGEQRLFGFGMRYALNDAIHLGVNAFYEEEDIALDDTTTDNTDPENVIKVYNDYQKQENKGALVSAKYIFTKQWEFTASYNYEEYEKWDRSSEVWDENEENNWGNSRTWGTLGVNYKPTRSSVITLEMNAGEAAQDAYAYARVYF
ncbi:putative porin [Vibrio sp. ES.051]|uniref:hypothetical protein n=1 Tax=Vibrio sp. ES.051 TaxID=1761909 RepID=UPI000BF964FF|nr:hypothetical protein [Vibrio sp. ES.051]PFG55104.1 putative porin [Vibrio sp. ES.051]